jgi:hypothetical protein
LKKAPHSYKIVDGGLLLFQGVTIEKRIHEDITYGDIRDSEDNLWNFLYFTGYMKKVSDRFEKQGRRILVTLVVS